jgi:hypothetical protein
MVDQHISLSNATVQKIKILTRFIQHQIKDDYGFDTRRRTNNAGPLEN